MRERRWGRVVCMASIAGLMGGFGQTAYATSKIGLIGFAKSVALEGARYNVTCNAIAPGIIAPNAKLSPLYDRMVKRVAMQREGEPEDVANAVAFLCSERARYITGAVLTVTGGMDLFTFRWNQGGCDAHGERDLRRDGFAVPHRQGCRDQRRDPVRRERRRWGHLACRHQGRRMHRQVGSRHEPEPDLADLGAGLARHALGQAVGSNALHVRQAEGEGRHGARDEARLDVPDVTRPTPD